MSQSVIHIQDGVPRKEEWRLGAPVSFTLLRGEHVAVTGLNGSGKSKLIDILTGAHPLIRQEVAYDFSPSPSHLVSDNIQYITFRDTYGGDNDRTYFLQQRWNQTEIDPETPTVRQKLEDAFLLSGGDTPERRALQQRLYALFGIAPLLDKYIILLSSGELRKFKLTSALFKDPRVLILDNPFIGLDAATRDSLRRLLTTLAEEGRVQIILVLSKNDDIPAFITHVVEVREGVVLPKLPLREWQDRRPPVPARVLSEEKERQILLLPTGQGGDRPEETVIDMRHVSVRYGARTIISDLNWTVRRGEHWVLGGENGSGKSTLLSIVCADNPQGYASDIRLFGHQRGTGESIWDIKRHIGYVSPEMHRSYRHDIAAIRIVASGLHDSIGLYVKSTEEDLEKCRFWMEVFRLKGMEERSFLSLSSGEQRLVLLARAFVKDPDLLILDEPLHGLDNVNRRLVKDVIGAYAARPRKTLIMVTHYEEEIPECIDHRLRLTKQG